jgi:hypothetical protein
VCACACRRIHWVLNQSEWNVYLVDLRREIGRWPSSVSPLDAERQGVVIVQSRDEASGKTTGVQFPAVEIVGLLFPRHCFQTGCETHLAFISWCLVKHTDFTFIEKVVLFCHDVLRNVNQLCRPLPHSHTHSHPLPSDNKYRYSDKNGS